VGYRVQNSGSRISDFRVLDSRQNSAVSSPFSYIGKKKDVGVDASCVPVRYGQ